MAKVDEAEHEDEGKKHSEREDKEETADIKEQKSHIEL